MEKTTLDESNKTKINNKKPGIKKNYFYNLVYQIFLLIIPLITTPYVSRILLADGVGKYSFSVSLITYFTIFAALGFGYYAQREIAKHQNDIKRQTEVFWEINICKLLPVAIALLTNIILCSLKVYQGYNILMWILNINILTVAFDINYFFQGNENFKSIIVRNSVIKIVAIVSIFVFVKKESDVWAYTLINSTSAFLSMVSMWVPIRKLIVKIDFKAIKPFRHLKGTLILFLPTIAVSIYTILDKTLIGVLIKDTYTALDENGAEVIKNILI